MRDYKPDNTWKKRRRVRLHGLVLVALVLIVLIGGVWAWFGGGDDQPALVPATAPPPAREQPQPIALPDKPKPKYDFYSELPRRQVEIGREEITPPKPAAEPTPPRPPSQPAAAAPKPAAPAASRQAPPPSKSRGRYVVQAGSFSSYAKADRQKAALAMLGIEARIESGTGSNNTTLHRVRIGPIDDAEKVRALRLRLQQNNIPSIAIEAD